MSTRLRPTDAFVDESIRGRRYLMGCVLIEAKNLSLVRRRAEALVLAGRRLHFHNESAARRRALLVAFAALPVSAFAVVSKRQPGISEFEARDRCLAAIVERLQAERVARLVIETRHDDSADQRTLSRVRAPSPELIYEHRPGVDEPLLWIADGVAWAVGAGRQWRGLLGTTPRSVAELGP